MKKDRIEISAILARCEGMESTVESIEAYIEKERERARKGVHKNIQAHQKQKND